MNRIGQFLFLVLLGQPEVHDKQTVSLVSRPGVDGVGLWLRGSRGRQFTMRSKVDAVNLAAARALYAQYHGLVGEDPVEMVWAGCSSTAEGYKVAVIDVRPVGVRGILGGVGGLHPPSRGWAEYEWDLVAIDDNP